MIDFIEKKKINWKEVKTLLKLSHQQNHWANFGPVSKLLEAELSARIKPDLAVIACCSATLALNCLINFYNFVNDRPLRWVVSSYGFPCTQQGPLMEAIIVDCDKNGMLDLNLLDGIKYDGLVVTNVFGTQQNLDTYRNFCKQNGKIFVADSATSFNNNEDSEVISFHHTKPWGFGEGGCIIVKKEFERKLRSIANLGMTTAEKIERWGTNAKISDINAAFILQRLRQINPSLYKNQYTRIKQIAISCGFDVLGECHSIPAHVPILTHNPNYQLSNDTVILKKYYKPLAKTPMATKIFDKIINFPCHPDVSKLNDKTIKNLLKSFC